MSWWAHPSVFLSVLLLGFLVACGGDRPDEAENRPSAFDPVLAGAIPRPPGFRVSDTHDQVAHAIGGGGLALVSLVLVQSNPDLGPQGESEVRAWYAERLTATGWVRERQGKWLRETAGEQFSLDTGRDKEALIIFTRLWRGNVPTDGD